jgi:hypothetical protein
LIDYNFFPSAERAQLIDRRMHTELGQSLRHVQEATAELWPLVANNIGQLAADLESGKTVSPGTFGRYYDLVSAVMNGEQGAALMNSLAISSGKELVKGLEVVSLGDQSLGDDSALYLRMMNADETVDIGFARPEKEIADAFRLRLADGIDFLNSAIPALSEEVQTIVRQVVIAGSDPSKKMQFDGGSHYQLWGALFINGNYHNDRIAVVEVLAHESAHSLLFGFCTDEPLVENYDDELFASPLRQDLRPMDGIFHATFVSARMHWAMSSLAKSGALSVGDRNRAEAAAQADLENFGSGYGVIRDYGKLTNLGRSILSSAKSYIDTVS